MSVWTLLVLLIALSVSSFATDNTITPGVAVEIYSEDIIDKDSGKITNLAKRKIVKKTVPPDVRALLFWLKNRYPDRWKDKVEPPPGDIITDFGEDEMNL